MNRNVAFLITCLLVGIECAKEQHAKWGYGGKVGPDHWAKMFPQFCAGERQSPIDLDEDEAVEDKTLGRIHFFGYESKLQKAKLENNGHTAQVTFEENPPMHISGGGLDGTYQFLQLHFHWGGESDRGSEHTLDNKDFPLEMHLVHYKKGYNTKEELSTKGDALAVLGILFEIDDEDNKELQPIIDLLDDIEEEGSSVILKDPLDLDDLLPDDTLPYFRYKGSLTTPPCNENVIWTVFKHTQHISENQLKKFRILKETSDGDSDSELEDNFRPPQPLNGRKVMISTDTGDVDDEDPDNVAPTPTPTPSGADKVISKALMGVLDFITTLITFYNVI